MNEVEEYMHRLKWTIKEHAAGNLTKEGTTMCDYCTIGSDIKENDKEPYSDATCQGCLFHPQFASEEGTEYLEKLGDYLIMSETLGMLDSN